jgi:hypothetical protein
VFGIRANTAGVLLVAAGDNPERLRSTSSSTPRQERPAQA